MDVLNDSSTRHAGCSHLSSSRRQATSEHRRMTVS